MLRNNINCKDVLNGGSGGDHFQFKNLSEGVDTIEDFNYHEGDKIVIGFSHDLSKFSENESTGEILFDGHVIAKVSEHAGSDFFDIHRDIIA